MKRRKHVNWILQVVGKESKTWTSCDVILQWSHPLFSILFQCFSSSYVPRGTQAPWTYRRIAENCRKWAVPVLGAWCMPCLGSVLSALPRSKQAVPMLPLSRLPSSSLDALYIELQCPPSFPQLTEIATAEYPPNRISSLSSSTHLKAT